MNQVNKLIRDIFTLVIVSALLGISAQAVLPNGISLRTEITVLGDDSTGVTLPSISISPNGKGDSATNISLLKAYSAYKNGSAIFFDARNPDAFRSGHIKRAINLPAHAFLDSLPYLENLDFNKLIITYCDGADCNASIDLAADLIMMGFSHVKFFFGGWQEWRNAGYPVESSP